jgi:4-hydroxy-tetrahydrodipicolinate reductase
MGQEAVLAIQNTPTLSLVASLGKADDLGQAITQTQAHAVVDLTTAEAAVHNTEVILKHKTYPIIGTSGLMPHDILKLQNLARKLNQGGIIVPNFSLGMVLMIRFAAQAARYFPAVEIIERHHPHKKDAPSHTALRTAEMIHAERTKAGSHAPSSGSETTTTLIPGARGGLHECIPIHSVRLSGSCAHQTIMLGGLDETLSFQHDTLSRKSYMPGLILACQKVYTLSTLVVGLEHLLDWV